MVGVHTVIELVITIKNSARPTDSACRSRRMSWKAAEQVASLLFRGFPVKSGGCFYRPGVVHGDFCSTKRERA